MIWIDYMSDAFRWWTSLGAFLATPLIVAWAGSGLGPLHPRARSITAFVMLLAMVGFMLAGAVIPFANENRIAGFTQQSVEFRTALMLCWGLWGCASWGCAIALAGRKLFMVAGSIWWLSACYLAAVETVGVSL